MSLAPYLIVSAACLGISYLLFRLLLRNEMLFLQQRVFLITSVVLSVILPFTGISITFPESSSGGATYSQLTASGNSSQAPVVSSGLDKLADMVIYIYIAVTLILTLIIVFQLVRIIWLYIVSEKSIRGNLFILRSGRIKTPFSFFSWIFIPSALKDGEETESVCIHESIHANQYHSLDNLILGLVCAVMWFNPVVWIIKRSMHLVHEYLADEGTLKRGIEKTRYQALLLNQAAEIKLISIPSGFNNNLKKRLIMMTKTKMKDTYRVKILSIIPLPVVLLLTVSILNGIFPGELKAQKQDTKKDTVKEIVVVGYGSQKQNIAKEAGKDTVNYIVDGVSVKNINDLNPDSIESINVLKSDRTVIIRTKKFAKKSGEPDAIKAMTPSDKTLYILDGNKISKAELDKIPVETIQSVSVRKDVGDGVVIVTTKKN